MYEELISRLKNFSMLDVPTQEIYGGARIATTSAELLERLQGLAQEAADAIEELSGKVEQLPRWISVTERLPVEEEKVLVYIDERMHIVTFSPTNQQFNNYDCLQYDEHNVFNGVTHWMPLPEPPKEGEE